MVLNTQGVTTVPMAAWSYRTSAIANAVHPETTINYDNEIIVANHSYSILGVYIANKGTPNQKNYIVLRNPYGRLWGADPTLKEIADWLYTGAWALEQYYTRSPSVNDGIFALEANRFDSTLRATAGTDNFFRRLGNWIPGNFRIVHDNGYGEKNNGQITLPQANPAPAGHRGGIAYYRDGVSRHRDPRLHGDSYRQPGYPVHVGGLYCLDRLERRRGADPAPERHFRRAAEHQQSLGRWLVALDPGIIGCLAGEYLPGGSDVYHYDIPTGTTTRVTDYPAEKWYPVIYGRKIVWMEREAVNEDMGSTYFDLQMADLDHPGQVINITPHAGTIPGTDDASHAYPSIWGDYVVWEDWDDTRYTTEIFMNDTATGTLTQISDDIGYGSKTRPAIYDTTIVWADDRNGDFDIFSDTVSTGTDTDLTPFSGSVQTNPAIYEDTVIWLDDRDHVGSYLPDRHGQPLVAFRGLSNHPRRPAERCV